MSLTTALFNAKSGLAATQRQVAGSSNNIANARTPGYVALDARVTSQNTAGIGTGVAAEMVRSPVDSILLRDLRLEAANLGTLDVRAQAIGRVETAIGDPADERSLAAAFTALETSFQELYDAPERADLQRQVFYAAREMTERFSTIEGTISTAREEADRAIETGVRTVNEALSQIENLNRIISQGISGGKDISGVLDERDRLIDTVSEQVGIRTYTRDRGEVVITTTEGVTLLDGTARELEFTRTTSIPAGANIAAGTVEGLSVDGFRIEPGPLAGSQALRSGAIAGNFIARDQDLVRFQEQMDVLARETILLFQESDIQVNAARNGLIGGAPPISPPVAPAAPDPTVAGLFTDEGNPFDPANLVGLSGRLQINALVDPDTPGGDVSRLRTGVVADADFAPDALVLDDSTAPGTLMRAYDPSVGALGDMPLGYKGQIERFLDGLSAVRNFTPANGLTDSTTLQNFASEYSTGVLNERANLEGLADRSRTIFDTLEIRRFNENGVNVDEESEKLLELEQAYAANAQVINVIARMFDELLARVA